MAIEMKYRQSTMSELNKAVPRKLIIVGTGETAELAFSYFSEDTDFEVTGFSVERAFIREESFHQLPIIPFENLRDRICPSDFGVFVAVSGVNLNRLRKRLFETVKDMGFHCPTYLSPWAFIGKGVEVGENCFIFEQNTLQAGVKVGNDTILWSGNHIGHNSLIGWHCFISSHVVICGFCNIGDGSFIGVNSTIENNLSIEKDNFIGAGAIIRKSTKEREVYQVKATDPHERFDSFRLFRIKEEK